VLSAKADSSQPDLPQARARLGYIIRSRRVHAPLKVMSVEESAKESRQISASLHTREDTRTAILRWQIARILSIDIAAAEPIRLRFRRGPWRRAHEGALDP